MSDDLLPPSVDPKIKTLGIRRVSGKNMATPRTVMMVRDHIVVSDEKETNTGPTPLEMALSALIGCEGVIINRCAEAMGFAYSAVIWTLTAKLTNADRAAWLGCGPILTG